MGSVLLRCLVWDARYLQPAEYDSEGSGFGGGDGSEGREEALKRTISSRCKSIDPCPVRTMTSSKYLPVSEANADAGTMSFDQPLLKRPKVQSGRNLVVEDVDCRSEMQTAAAQNQPGRRNWPSVSQRSGDTILDFDQKESVECCNFIGIAARNIACALVGSERRRKRSHDDEACDDEPGSCFIVA